MICIPMLMVGGIFAEALTMASIFFVTVAGFAICCLLIARYISFSSALQRNKKALTNIFGKCRI